MFATVFMILAVALLTAAAFGVPSLGRINLLAAGLACWAVTQLLPYLS